jgi:hypothetical protein
VPATPGSYPVLNVDAYAHEETELKNTVLGSDKDEQEMEEDGYQLENQDKEQKLKAESQEAK